MGMGAPVFLGIWVVMMAAMMFPTAAPMILTFSRVQGGKKERGQIYVPTWTFVAAYLAVWVLFGALAYAAAVAAEALAEDSMWLMDNATKFSGSVLMVAGVLSFRRLKASV
jgi:predicted metal-binding membrane protein